MALGNMNEAEKYLAASNAQTRGVGGTEWAGHSRAAAGGACGKPGNKGALAGLALLSGLFAIITSIARQLPLGILDSLATAVVAPPVEEILKVAIPIMVLEHRAKWLSRGKDLLWFAMGSALVFSVVENLLYQFWYLENPGTGILLWRWTACTAMHLAASGLAGVGLLRAYERGLRTGRNPRFVWEWPWLAGAIAVHMAYNTFAEFFAEPFY